MPDFFLADDLSGALDAAAAFHHAGRRVTTRLAFDQPGAGEERADVVALTTETRNAAPALAAERVARVVTEIRTRGGRLLFKKIDSTMRGPVAAELAALAAAMPEARILFTPANPAVGRTVRAGVLRVNGVPVAETEFGRDPLSPVRESSLPKLLGAAATDRVVIADAETQDDLDAAVARMAAADGPWIAVGSGALARAVATRGETRAVVPPREWPAIASRAMLMVCGSAHPANRRQAERLRRERGVALHELSLADPQAGIRAAVASLAASGTAALAIELARAESGGALRAIAAAAAELIATTGVRRVFVTGGETAFAVCGALGISSLEFLEEIEIGVSVSGTRTAGGPMLLAVKPGGFGDEATWVRIWDRLKHS